MWLAGWDKQAGLSHLIFWTIFLSLWQEAHLACDAGFQEKCYKGRCRCLGLEGSKCSGDSNCLECPKGCYTRCKAKSTDGEKVCNCFCKPYPVGEQCEKLSDCQDTCSASCGLNCVGPNANNKLCTCDCPPKSVGEKCSVEGECTNCPYRCDRDCRFVAGAKEKTCFCYCGQSPIACNTLPDCAYYCNKIGCVAECRAGTPYQKNKKGICYCNCAPIERGAVCEKADHCQSCPKSVSKLCQLNGTDELATCGCTSLAAVGGDCKVLEACAECSGDCLKDCSGGKCVCNCPPFPLGARCSKKETCAPCPANCTRTCDKVCGCQCLRIPGPCEDTSTCPNCPKACTAICQSLAGAPKKCSCKCDGSPYRCQYSRDCSCSAGESTYCLSAKYLLEPPVELACFCQGGLAPIGYGSCGNRAEYCESCPENANYTLACNKKEDGYYYCECLAPKPQSIQAGGLCNDVSDCSCPKNCISNCTRSGPDPRSPQFCSCDCYGGESSDCFDCADPCTRIFPQDPKNPSITLCKCKCPILAGAKCERAEDCEACPFSQCKPICESVTGSPTELVCGCSNCQKKGEPCAVSTECLPCPAGCKNPPACTSEYPDEDKTCTCDCAPKGCPLNKLIGTSNNDCQMCGDCACSEERVDFYARNYWCYNYNARCTYQKWKSLEECSKNCQCDGGQCDTDRVDPKIFLCATKCKYRTYNNSEECDVHCRCKYGKCISEQVQLETNYTCIPLPTECDFNSTYLDYGSCLENCPCPTGECYDQKLVVKKDVWACANNTACDHNVVFSSAFCKSVCGCPQGDCQQHRLATRYDVRPLSSCYHKECKFGTLLKTKEDCKESCGCFDGLCVLSKEKKDYVYKCQNRKDLKCGSIVYKTQVECSQNCYCSDVFDVIALVQNETVCKQRDALKDWFCFKNVSCTPGVKYEKEEACLESCKCPEQECVDLTLEGGSGFLCKQRNCLLGEKKRKLKDCQSKCDCTHYKGVTECRPTVDGEFRCQENPTCVAENFKPGTLQLCDPDVKCVQKKKDIFYCVDVCVTKQSFVTVAECNKFCYCKKNSSLSYDCIQQANGTFACHYLCNHSLTFTTESECKELCDCADYSCLDVGKQVPAFKCLKSNAKIRTTNCDRDTGFKSKERCVLNCRCKTASACNKNRETDLYFCQDNKCQRDTSLTTTEAACKANCTCAEAACIKRKEKFECLTKCAQHDVGFKKEEDCKTQCKCVGDDSTGRCTKQSEKYYCDGPCAFRTTIFPKLRDCQVNCGNCREQNGLSRTCVSNENSTYSCRYKCPTFGTKYDAKFRCNEACPFDLCGGLCDEDSTEYGKYVCVNHAENSCKLNKYTRALKTCLHEYCFCGKGFGCQGDINKPKEYYCGKICAFDHYFEKKAECEKQCLCKNAAGCFYSLTIDAWFCQKKKTAVYNQVLRNQADCKSVCVGDCAPNGPGFQCYSSECASGKSKSSVCVPASYGPAKPTQTRKEYKCNPGGFKSAGKELCLKCCGTDPERRCIPIDGFWRCVTKSSRAISGCDYTSTFVKNETCVQEACFCKEGTCYSHTNKGLTYYKCAEDFDKIPKTCTYGYRSTSKYRCRQNCVCDGIVTACSYETLGTDYQCEYCVNVIGVYYDNYSLCQHRCSDCGNCMEYMVNIQGDKLTPRHLCEPKK